MSPRLPNALLAVQSDGRLVELAARGQERAFEALVKRYRTPLLRYCRRLGIPEANAEDVVQQSFTQAWLALSGGAQVREPRAWLYRVAHNTAVSARRSAGVAAEPLPVEGVSALPEPPAAAERSLAARDALGHVAALPPMQRDAIVLTAIQGCSHEEAAGVLGISDGAVRGLVHRARTAMRGAAAALTPQGLLEWLSRGSSTLPAAERTGEIAAGAATFGAAGAALKGALVAAGAGLVLAGSVAVHAIRRHEAAQHTAVAASRGTGATQPGPLAPSSSATPAVILASGMGSAPGHAGARRSTGAAGSSGGSSGRSLPRSGSAGSSSGRDEAAAGGRTTVGRAEPSGAQPRSDDTTAAPAGPAEPASGVGSGHPTKGTDAEAAQAPAPSSPTTAPDDATATAEPPAKQREPASGAGEPPASTTPTTGEPPLTAAD